jgi:hypothetical protein
VGYGWRVKELPERRQRFTLIHVFALLVMGVTLFHASPAPANVQEQRARLPPPATCTDPVEGVWLSHTYNPDFQDWYMFTLRIRRITPGSDQLIGDIESHSWNGSPTESEPPACRFGLNHWTVQMTAQGSIDKGAVSFAGTQWQPKETFCGHGPGMGEYNLDHFSGQIDPALQEFQSVNNDGGRSVNEPAVFRRIGCLEPPPVPHVQVAPPSFYPPGRGGGCGCGH